GRGASGEEWARYDAWLHSGPSRARAETDEMRKSLVLQKLELRDILRAIENEDFSTHRARWGSPGTHGLLVLDYDRLTFDPSEREPLVAAADAVPPLPGEDLAAWRDRGFADYVRPDLTREQRLEFFRARLARVPNISY